MIKFASEADRLWKYCTPGAPSDCWLWTGGCTADGYGKMTVRGEGVLSHRFSFFLANGYWPNIARHSCDNPPCCNPAHILDGTQIDNVADMMQRGRVARGARASRVVLTEESVREIKASLGLKSMASLAREYGVAPSTIDGIARGKNWKYVK